MTLKHDANHFTIFTGKQSIEEAFFRGPNLSAGFVGSKTYVIAVKCNCGII